MGFPYASFKLGDYVSTTQGAQLNYRQGNQEWALYLQDTWKATRKLTIDYGLRSDFATRYKEQYNRLGQFDPTLANGNAGGHVGATRYASNCNCEFYPNPYPYAIGPRLGVAYQLDEKTVIRGGFGVNYQFVAASGGGIVSTNGAYPLSGINSFVNIQTPGSIVQPSWPVTDPNRFPTAGTVTGAPVYPDPNNLRPPRVSQWSLGIQRQLTKDLLVEAAYVGNRGVWELGSAFAVNGPLAFLSQISPAQYASLGLYQIGRAHV